MFVDVVEDVREDEGDLAEINWTLQQFNIDELTDYYKNPRSQSACLSCRIYQAKF